MLFGSVRAREMANELSGQFVYFDALKFVEFFTLKTENARLAHCRDMDAMAVENFSVFLSRFFLFTHFFAFSPISIDRAAWLQNARVLSGEYKAASWWLTRFD